MSPIGRRSISVVAALGCAAALYKEAYRSASGLALIALLMRREPPSVKEPTQKGPMRKSASSPALFHLEGEVRVVSILGSPLDAQTSVFQSLPVQMPPPEAPLRRLKLSEIPQQKSNRWLSKLRGYVQPLFRLKPEITLLADHPEIVNGVLYLGKGRALLLDWESIFSPSTPLSLILSFEPLPQAALNSACERARGEMGSILMTFFPIRTRVDSLARPLIVSQGASRMLVPDFLPKRRIQQIEMRFPAKSVSGPGGVRDLILKEIAQWSTLVIIALALRENGELQLIFSEEDTELKTACEKGVAECNAKYHLLEYSGSRRGPVEGKSQREHHLRFRALLLAEERGR